MNSGIYKISNSIDNRVYIGSSCNLKERIAEHKRDLLNNSHHCVHLQRFVNKYSVDVLSFDVIDFCLDDLLLIKEQWYLDNTERLFNVSVSAHSPMKGLHHSEVSKQKIRINTSGEKNHMYGKKRPKYVIDALLKVNKGRKKTVGEINKRIKNLPNRTPVSAYNNSILFEADSIQEMSVILKVKHQSVSKALKKKHKCRGFTISK